MLKIDLEGDDNDPSSFTFDTKPSAMAWLLAYWQDLGHRCENDLFEMPENEDLW